MSKQEPVVVCDPEMCHGEPFVRGFRFPVATLFQALSIGQTATEVELWYDLPGGTVSRVIQESIEALRERGRPCGSK